MSFLSIFLQHYILFKVFPLPSAKKLDCMLNVVYCPITCFSPLSSKMRHCVFIREGKKTFYNNTTMLENTNIFVFLQK